MRRCRGAILMEVVLSIALFVGAAAFALGSVRQVLTALDRAERRQQAVDVARTTLAELEAGVINVADLREAAGEGGAVTAFDRDDGPALRDVLWEIDLTTSRSEFRGLTLVELTVTETPTAGADADDRVWFTLRQLVRLRESGAEDYQIDDLLKGLPEVAP